MKKRARARSKQPSREDSGFFPLRSELSELKGRLPPPSLPPAELAEPAEEVLELTEAELMQLAFDALGPGAPELDLARVRVVHHREVTPAVGEETDEGLDDEAVVSSPVVSRPGEPDADPRLGPLLARKNWSGMDWRDRHPVVSDGPPSWLGKVPRTLSEINLRRLGRTDALAQLEAFIPMARALGEPFVRVISGKGLGSRQGAVLTPAVEEWLRSRRDEWIRDWFAEKDEDGRYGSLIVWLRLRRRP